MPARFRIHELTPWLLTLLAALFGIKQLDNSDTWWHLASGRWMVENWSIPSQDVLSFTVPGHDWINLQWLFDLLMYAVYQVGEAGALVLADKGICCIDEMDKMRPEDRVAIHEAMEQHTVSVAKGGIVATLNARTAILAAANPALGRYEPHRTVAENISLPVTILSRFDLIFVLRDVPDKESDKKLTKHILEIHRRGRQPVEAEINSDLLRKYVGYAKTIRPELSSGALKVLGDFYLAMRSASEDEGSPIAITARQLESLIRVSEARARVALRKKVTAQDAEAAITIMQRSLSEVGIDVSLDKVDIDIIMTGRPKSVGQLIIKRPNIAKRPCEQKGPCCPGHPVI